MTDALGGPIAGVYANLYDWGYPSQDMVPLTQRAGRNAAVYSSTFTAVSEPRRLLREPAGRRVGFEDQSATTAASAS